MKYHKPPQAAPHAALHAVVQTHFEATWRRPVSSHSIEAFQRVKERVSAHPGELMLDSCCGTGQSTRYLAEQFPNALILGVDKSAHRLDRHGSKGMGDYELVRADVNDFWRLAEAAGWRLARHFLFYPNPYPKASQLRKRWYASPAFPVLLRLGGYLTVRTNWQVYAEEFQQALGLVGYEAGLQALQVNSPISAFETKYQAQGDTLFELTSDLDVGNAVEL